MNKREQFRTRLEQVIVEEINIGNLIAQNELEIFIPKFIQNLTDRIQELAEDEFKYRR